MPELQPVPWEKVVRAVEKVRERLRRAAAALEVAGVPYAITGGNAVAAWVSEVDEAAARSTQDVDVLLRRADLPVATAAMQAAGFVHRRAAGIDMFLDGPDVTARNAVHVLFAGEKVRAEYVLPAADVAESEALAGYRVVSLEALVRMKLTSFRDKDRTHVRDLIGVGLIDDSWLGRVPAPLSERLKTLLDDPDG